MKLHPDQMGHHRRALRDRHPSTTLPVRLQPIVTLAAQGHKNDQIGSVLCLSAKTVKNYIRDLSSYFGTTHRTAMVLEAMRQGYAPCPHNCYPARLPQRKPRPRRKP